MKNRKLRKILLTICSAMLLVCLSVGATVAYLTATDTVTNTFTVGKVAITLDEAEVNTSGVYVTDKNDRTDENSYHLLPGHEYIKDPTIHIDDASEDAYLALVITVASASKTDAFFSNYAIGNVLEGWTDTASQWKVASNNVANDTRTYVLFYGVDGNVTINGETDDITLFSKVKVPADVTNEELAALGDTQLSITAYAVQKDGFSTCDAAMKAAFPNVFAVE